MTDLKDTARQALEALGKWSSGRDMDAVTLNDLIATLEAALEQPEPTGKESLQVEQPVAWCDIEEDGTIHGLRYWSEPGRREHALYAHPPRREWRGLTEEELAELAGGELTRDERMIARAIEAALKEKNHE